MGNENFTAPLDQFSEYAMSVENEDYPKTDFSQFGFRGKIDHAAFSEAYDEALVQQPLFSSHLFERREGLLYQPYWVFDAEVPNKLQIVDCRHMAGPDPFDPMEFTTRYYAQRLRRRFDLAHEFPFNCSLLRVKDDKYIFSILYHHSAMDPAKAYKVITDLLARYHEKVTGKPPEWAKTLGMAALKRKGGLIKPVGFGKFVLGQLNDIWFQNNTSSLSKIACEQIKDYRKTKGRHSLRSVIDDPKLIAGLMARSEKNQATLNDLMLAVMRKTLTQWNRDRDQSAQRFRMMIITSLKGRTELSTKTAGADVSAINWVSKGHEDTDLDTLTQIFRDTRKQHLSQGLDILTNQLMKKVVSMSRIMPMRTRFKVMHAASQSVPCTYCLSNLGVVWPRYENGRPTMDSQILGAGDFVIDDIHSSASLGRSLEISVTTRTHNRRLYINFIMDRFRFRFHEAKALKDKFVEDLINAV
jgi:NRPS condensation-like uncharacterized protein